jgi:hypothetical protein
MDDAFHQEYIYAFVNRQDSVNIHESTDPTQLVE